MLLTSCLLPPGEGPGRRGPPAVRVKLADTPAEWAGAVGVRLAVFVAEQGVALAAELDEHDRTGIHAVAVLDPPLAAAHEASLLPARSGVATRAAALAGRFLPVRLAGARTSLKAAAAAVVGTGRLLPASGGLARIGRVAVLPAWRGRGLGSRLLRLLEEAALARGAARVEVRSQVSARAFYARHGYTVVAPGNVFDEDGIPHVRLSKLLPPDL